MSLSDFIAWTAAAAGAAEASNRHCWQNLWELGRDPAGYIRLVGSNAYFAGGGINLGCASALMLAGYAGAKLVCSIGGHFYSVMFSETGGKGSGRIFGRMPTPGSLTCT